MNEDLYAIAEIAGAFTGDGWIEARENALYITGHKTEDKPYYDSFLSNIFSKNFAKVSPREFVYWSVYGIVTYKKKVVAKAISLGFQVGKKSLIAKTPSWILESKDNHVVAAFIRGVFDTDGSFWCDRSRAKTSGVWKRTHYSQPVISITSCSKDLITELHCLLQNLQIESSWRQTNEKRQKYGRNNSTSYELRVRKRLEVEKWFTVIGSNNPKHLTKYIMWKKLSHLPQKQTLQERINFLNNSQ